MALGQNFSKSSNVTNATEHPNIMEPLVQIKTEPPSAQESQDAAEPDLQIFPHPTEPEIQIIVDPGHISTSITPQDAAQHPVDSESPDKSVKPEHRSFFENIGLFENSNTVAKIGECTISVSNSSTSNLLTSKNIEANNIN